MDGAQRTSAAELRARILGAAAQEPSAPRASHARRNATFIALGFALAAAMACVERTGLGAFGRAGSRRLWHVVAEGQVPTHDPPLGFVVTLEGMWILVAVIATWAGATRGHSMLGRSWPVKVGVATATPLALVFTWLGVAFVWRRSVVPLAWLEAMTDDGLQFHASCAVMSILYAVGPFLAFFAVRRHRDPVMPRQTGAALGAVAGAWGAVVHLWLCSCTSPLHMALGHVLPVVALACLGALTANRVLGLRTSA